MKKAFIIGGAAILIGIIVMTVAVFNTDFNVNNLFSQPVREEKHDIAETFDNVVIESENFDFRIMPSSDGQCRIVAHKNENIPCNPKVENNTLTISQYDNREWYDYIKFSDRADVTIYLPQKEYNGIKITTNSGDIQISRGLIFKNLTANAQSGDIDVHADITENIDIKTRSGEIETSWNNIKSVNIVSASGDVDVLGNGGENIYIETTSGDVEGVISGDVNIQPSTRSGEIEVRNRNLSGKGKCVIKTQSGDIELE